MNTISVFRATRMGIQWALSGIKRSSFIKNILIVMSGTAAAQIIGFALTPVISRLFSPNDFGVFGSFSSISAIIAAGATLEYTQAIMLPKEKEHAINLFVVSCLCTFAVSLLTLLFCLLYPAYLHDLMKTSGVWILALLVLATLVNGLNNSCQAWCVRVKAFNQTSTSQVIRSLSSNGAQIGFGIFKGGAAGLIISNVFADMLASLNLLRVLLPDVIALRRHITWGRMKYLAKEYIDFPAYAAPQNVINALSSGLPVLLLTHFYGISVAGLYAFGARILLLPMGLVLRSLRQVLFQAAGERQHQGGRLLPLYVKTTSGLFALALFPAMILFIWAPEIFSLIFGSGWLIAGEYAQYLIIWLMFYFCNLPAVLFAQLIRIQRTFFIYDLALLVGRASALLFGGLYLSASKSILLFSLVGAVMNVFLIVLVGYNVMKKEGRTGWRSIWESLMDR